MLFSLRYLNYMKAGVNTYEYNKNNQLASKLKLEQL